MFERLYVTSFFFTEKFATEFVASRGIDSILALLTSGDDGARLVAAKALTMAAYTAPSVTRGAVHARGGHQLLISLLSADNEFVQVQTAWALSQLLTSEHEDPMTYTFVSKGGVQPLERMFLASTSPALILRSLAALVPLYGIDTVRNAAANQGAIIKKISVIMSSQQPPLKAQALYAATRLCASAACQDMFASQGTLALVASFLSSTQPQVLAAAIEMLLLLVDSPIHRFVVCCFFFWL